jgi:hypothetical protein
MFTVWNYRAEVCGGKLALRVPRGGQILGGLVNGDGLQISALVDPRQAPETRNFEIHSAGNIFDAGGLSHVGPILLHGVDAHLFERRAT